MTKSGKYYAVRGGRNGFSGIVNTWADCQNYVKGVRGVRYKKFVTLADAQRFVDNVSDGPPSKPKKTIKKKVGGGDSLNVPESAKDSLVAYTDGACSGNGREGARAGYGVFFESSAEYNVSERLPGKPTNQRAEMMAVLVAMRVAYERRLVSAKKGLLIFTDSDYTLNGITKWTAGWKMRNWKTSAGSDVKNRDLWEELDEMKSTYDVDGIPFDLVWVKGHNNLPGNEAADRLAVAGAAKSLSK